MNKSSMANKLDCCPHKQEMTASIDCQVNKLANKQHRLENLDSLVKRASSKSLDLLVCIVEMHNAMDLLASSLGSLVNILWMKGSSLVNLENNALDIEAMRGCMRE